jgi:hypothetical protein
MDKVEFVRTAPAYYLAATLTVLKRRNSGAHFTLEQLRSTFVIGNDDEHFLTHDELINLALDKLVSDGAISKIGDPFGDALFRKTDQYDQVTEKITDDPNGPYFRNLTANDQNFWLRGALRKVNELYLHLGITPEDFTRELPDEWTPIQINPDEPAIQEAVRQLQEATTAVEQDNGYSATYPQERDQVVQDLQGGLEKLKSNTVSIGWLRRTVNALKTASLRFANTTKGQMIDGAFAAVKDVIKHHIGNALEGLWSYFF